MVEVSCGGPGVPGRCRSMAQLCLRWAARLLGFSLIVSVVAVLVYRFVDPPLTPLMAIRAGEAFAAGRRPHVERQWVDLERVSPNLLRAVLAAEDARFLEHRGVDVDALRRAAAWNQRHGGRRLRGAGTITMQCARNVFLWPGRSYFRKALEIYFAPLLELLWGKRRIFEVYLNVIEWGPGLYGVEAASRAYFGVPAAALAPRQAALLAAVLPDPRRWNPAAPTRYLSARAATIEVRAVQTRVEPLT